MKMLLSKCRLFIIFLTFCYVLDSVFAIDIGEILRKQGFNGNWNDDMTLCNTKIAEYENKNKNESPGFSNVAADRIELYQEFLSTQNVNETGLLDTFKIYYDSLKISNNRKPVFYN